MARETKIVSGLDKCARSMIAVAEVKPLMPDTVFPSSPEERLISLAAKPIAGPFGVTKPGARCRDNR